MENPSKPWRHVTCLIVSLLLGAAASSPASADGASAQLTVVYAFDQNHISAPTPAFALSRGGLLYGAVGTDIYPGAASGGDILGMDPQGGDIQTVHVVNASTEGVLPMNLIQASDGNFYGATLHSYKLGGGGIIFKMTPQGALTVLNDLDSDAGYPGWALGPLAEGRNGDLYGTTYSGGNKYYCGVAFKLTKSGQYTLLHNINPATEGCGGIGGLVAAPDGNFYGTTSFAEKGGPDADDLGAVFRMTPEGKVTVIHTFLDGPDGSCPRGPLTVGGDGNLYGVTGCGPSPMIFKVTMAGDFIPVYKFDTSTAQGATSNITMGADGNLYGRMGTNVPSGGVFYRVAPDGTGFTQLYVFPPALPMDPRGFWTQTDLIEASPGNFYALAGPSAGTHGATFLYRLTVTN